MNEYERQTLINPFLSFVVVLSFTSGDVYDLSSDPDNSQTSVRILLNTIFYILIFILFHKIIDIASVFNFEK